MIKAALQMLEKPVTRSKIDCARIILEKVIESMTANPLPPVPTGPVDTYGLSPEAISAQEELEAGR